jgi:hypothetical protein
VSWTRAHIEELAELQIRTQRIIESAGTDAPGVDWLVEVNECLTNAEGLAAVQILRRDGPQGLEGLLAKRLLAAGSLAERLLAKRLLAEGSLGEART